nr:MAG TPA: hypothetical protein [Caudoviricetes sp.]
MECTKIQKKRHLKCVSFLIKEVFSNEEIQYFIRR